jgi:hypothetical protein
MGTHVVGTATSMVPSRIDGRPLRVSTAKSHRKQERRVKRGTHHWGARPSASQLSVATERAAEVGAAA